MKSLYILIAILFFNLTIQGQDLIITTKDDSIKCKIINVSPQHIRYWALFKHEVKKFKIPASEVKRYEKNFYTPKNTPAATSRTKTDYHKFTISPYGGFSYLLAKINSQVPTSLRQYTKELKSGYHFGADATFFLSHRTGVGIKYTSFQTSNEAFVTSSNNQSGTLRDDIITQYIAPVVVSRRMSKNQKTAFISDFSLGYLAYTNNATLIDNFKLSGGTLGLGFDLGMDRYISKTLGVGIKLGVITGTLGKYKKSDGTSVQTITLEDGQRENLSRLDISVALKWHY